MSGICSTDYYNSCKLVKPIEEKKFDLTKILYYIHLPDKGLRLVNIKSGRFSTSSNCVSQNAFTYRFLAFKNVFFVAFFEDPALGKIFGLVTFFLFNSSLGKVWSV